MPIADEVNAANADAIPCITCQFKYGCRVPFERCSGLDRI